MKLQHKFYLSLVIFVIAVVFALPPQFKTVFEQGQPLGFLNFIAAPQVNLGLDLQGGTQLEYSIDLSKVRDEDQQAIIDGVIEVINKRVNALGVAEPNVYASDIGTAKHIYVELAGISDIEEAKRTVGKTIQLEFKEQKEAASEADKEGIRMQADEARTEIAGDPEQFSLVGQRIQSGEVVRYETLENFLDQMPQGLADKITEQTPGTVLEETLLVMDGYTFQAETGTIVPNEGYVLVKLNEVRTELRSDPVNAEDFLTVASEVSEGAVTEVGYVRSDADVPYVAAVDMLEANTVSDLIEGEHALYVAKSLSSFGADAELRDVEVLSFAKENVQQLEEQQNNTEVIAITNERAKTLGEETLVTITPENFMTVAMATAQAPANLTFVEYTGQVLQIMRDDQTIPSSLREQVFAAELNTVIPQLVEVEGGLAVVLVRQEPTADLREIEQILFKQQEVPSAAEVDEARIFNQELQETAASFLTEVTAENFTEQAQQLAENNALVTYTPMEYATMEAMGEYGVFAFDLAEGGISQVIDTPNAYYVLRVRGVKPAGVAMDKLQLATICYGENCAPGRSYEEAKVLADTVIKRVREEQKYVYEQIFFSTTPDMWEPALVEGKALTGEFFSRADVGYAPGNQVVVSVSFNAEGARMFEEITARNIGKPLAIFVGGEMISAPMIRERIAGGMAQISGGFTVLEANQLARDLNTGALPAPIELVGQQTIGATLGQTALDMSIRAAVVGIILLFLYMMIWYRFPGFVANVALVIYMVIMLALVKIFGVVLTLAGIAALILSIGLAVDANILIFERLREELAKGKELKSAIKMAFERAWASVWDANISSILIALILYFGGVGVMKGFAFMLLLGIIVSMFSAVYVSRVLLLMIANTKWGEKLLRL